MVLIEQEELQKQQQYSQKVSALHAGTEKYAYVVTYGCQQNENDSEKLRGMLSDMGYRMTDNSDLADCIIYNTCAVRENAELRVFGNIGALKHLKRRKPELVIGVCGCMMQQEHIVKQIRQKYRHVDLVFGTHTLYRFPEILYHALAAQERVFDVEQSDGRIAEGLPVKRDASIKANISIMYGCNNFCSYCIVPYVRGRERSRSVRQIIDEINSLCGCREITLLGQNVNSFGKDTGEMDFSGLLELICRETDIPRIRFMTSHPKDFTEKLVKTMADHKQICNQLHLPFQAGNDRVLKEMNRSYTSGQYLEKINMVKEAIPDVVLTSDVIVGFPGETNEEFLDTLRLVEKVRFDSLFTFIYSKRSGTPAANMPDVLTAEEKQANFEKLLSLQNQISREINESYDGKIVEVLAEGHSKTDLSMQSGRTEGGKVVNFKAPLDCTGQFVKVKIDDVKTWSLNGRIIES